ncbi:hypothetical protein SAMN05421858_2936 [Haladaptatus litoreus]|uniref:Uncharacterized protein n=1 Tax=Haladaptatus litoreus TaxID=553468 RepID=A0A1N7C3E8_9EURY|nr:hypothetical protein SAMN05421858_2936 [Haladaptatus litoreus]
MAMRNPTAIPVPLKEVDFSRCRKIPDEDSEPAKNEMKSSYKPLNSADGPFSKVRTKFHSRTAQPVDKNMVVQADQSVQCN